jgi:hypothetical protein
MAKGQMRSSKEKKKAKSDKPKTKISPYKAAQAGASSTSAMSAMGKKP